MATPPDSLRLTKQEIADAFASSRWDELYPPLLTVDQAAELLQIPKSTLYEWRSQGRLKGCGRKLGKHVRFFRDRLVLRLMNEGV